MSLVLAPPASPTDTFGMLAPAVELAERIAATEFVPTSLRNRPEAVVACILYGHEIGVEPMQSLAEIAIIEGKPAISAQLMRARVLAHGHELWAEEASTTKVTLCAKRRDSERTHKITWTMDDARKAGLAGRPNWARYPRAMLTARATAELCRLAFPDVLGPARWVPEELEGGELPPDVLDVPEGAQEAPRKVTRKRPPPRAVAVEPDVPAIETTASEPERPPLPGEPLDRPEPMSEAAKRKMFAALRDVGIIKRDQRLSYVGNVVGHAVDSSDELTAAEGAAVIDAAEELFRQLQSEPPEAPA